MQTRCLNPFRWSYRASFLIGFLICVALLGFAVYTELAWGLMPCPLCIFQRIGFMWMAVFFLLGGLHAPRSAVHWIYTGGALLGAAWGLATAGRHVWIQLLPADHVPSCGPPLDYMFSNFPFARMMELVLTGSGECAQTDLILGLPMPAWSLLGFLLLALLAVSASLRKALTASTDPKWRAR